MSNIVNIVFGSTREYSLIARDAWSRDQANDWFDDQWEALECEASNPTGKVLMFDKIVSIARYGGEKRFTEPGDWAQGYANAVAGALGRPVVRIDVSERTVR